MTARNAANAGSKQGPRVTERRNLSQSFGSILSEKGFWKEVRGMNVKDLITELLDHDLDATIEISIDSPEESNDFDFEIAENRFSQSKYVSLQVNLTDYVLVDKNDFEEMKEQISGLESEVDSLRDMLAEYE